MFQLFKIDLLDTFIYADVFEDDVYTSLSQTDNLENLLQFAINEFKSENTDYKTFKEWRKNAENGGYEMEIFKDNSSLFRGSMILVSPIIENALNLALKYHSGVKRKGDGLPYLIHILDISALLYNKGREIDIDPNILCASICHDLLEDTACSEKEIETNCNKEVLNIVKAVSADDSIKDWKTKKKQYIESVRDGGAKAQIVCCADKIVNLNSLIEQHKIDGDVIWKKFNKGKETKKWFEYSVLSMLKEENNIPDHLIEYYEKTLDKFYN